MAPLLRMLLRVLRPPEGAKEFRHGVTPKRRGSAVSPQELRRATGRRNNNRPRAEPDRGNR